MSWEEYKRWHGTDDEQGLFDIYLSYQANHAALRQRVSENMSRRWWGLIVEYRFQMIDTAWRLVRDLLLLNVN